jgi:hypothetical protein
LKTHWHVTLATVFKSQYWLHSNGQSGIEVRKPRQVVVANTGKSEFGKPMLLVRTWFLCKLLELILIICYNATVIAHIDVFNYIVNSCTEAAYFVRLSDCLNCWIKNLESRSWSDARSSPFHCQDQNHCRRLSFDVEAVQRYLAHGMSKRSPSSGRPRAELPTHSNSTVTSSSPNELTFSLCVTRKPNFR